MTMDKTEMMALADEPNFYSMSDGELLAYCGADARKWAAAFCQIKASQGWSADDIDTGLMVVWFANAIETACDTLLAAGASAGAVKELDRAALFEAGKALCEHTPLFIDGFKSTTSYTEEALEKWRHQAIAAAECVVRAYLDAANPPAPTPAPDAGYVAGVDELTSDKAKTDRFRKYVTVEDLYAHSIAPAAPVSVDEVAWQALDSAPRDGTLINVRAVSTYRYQPYKPSSPQRKKGIRGRWQVANDYGSWGNCPEPCGEWSPLLDAFKMERK